MKYIVISYHNSNTYKYPKNGISVRKVFDTYIDAKKYVKKDIYSTSHRLFNMISDAKFQDIIQIKDMSWEFKDKNHDIGGQHIWSINELNENV